MTVLKEVIRELQVNHWSYLGANLAPEIQVIETISHPNSQIVRLRASWGDNKKTLFAKILYPNQTDGRSNRSDRQYKEDQIKTEYRVLKKLHEGFACYPNLGVVKPIACFAERLILITEEQPGLKLSSLTGNVKIYTRRDQIKQLLQWIYLCGTWLRLFQEFIPANGNVMYQFKEVLDYCEVRLDILAHQRPNDFTDAFCMDVRDFIRQQIESLRDTDLEIAGRHNDYSPNNIIVSSQKIVLLDFSGFSYGPVCCDYVKFWSGLDLMKNSFFVLDRTVEELQEAFLNGYGKKVDPDEPVFLLFHVAYILDKIGDIWLDWPTIPWMKRPVYRNLCRRYLAWLKNHC